MAENPNLKKNKGEASSLKKKQRLSKITIIVLLLLLVGAIGYIVKLTLDKSEQEIVITKAIDEKQEIIADLELLKETYDRILQENTTISEELEAERTKVIKLLEDVQKAETNLTTYKERYRRLEGKLVALTRENEQLKVINSALTKEIDSTKTALFSEIEHAQILSEQNQKFAKDIETASELVVSNVDVSTLNIKKSGKEIKTNKAKKINWLKIGYTVTQNNLAEKGTKSYYIQVINNRMNVLKQTGKVDFGTQTLAYTLISTFDFEGNTLKVIEQVKVEKLEKGLYFINIFDQDKKIATKQITIE